MAAGHEILEHTADLGVRVWGDSMEEAFEEAAWALVEIVGIRGEGVGRPHPLSASGADPGALLVDLLNELILLIDTEPVAVTSVAVQRATDSELEVELGLVPREGEAEGANVKAATYHQLRVERRPDGGVEARVFLDV